MNKKVLALSVALISLLVLWIASTQSVKANSETPQVQWSKTYGIAGELGNSAIQTLDGGYTIAGANGTKSLVGPGYGKFVPLLTKTNSQGEIEWQKTYQHQVGYAIANSVVQTQDTGYLLFCGNCMIKTDAQGNFEWNNSLGSSKGILGKDGGFVLIGYRPAEQSSVFALQKTNSQGELLWSKTFPDKNSSIQNVVVAGNHLIETIDGGYAIVGTWNASCWLLKTDAFGNILLNRTYKFDYGSGQYQGFSIELTLDGGYVMSVFINSAPLLAKVDSSGNLLWVRDDYAQYGAFESIVQTDDGGFLAVGSQGWNAWILRANSSGTKLWDSTYGNQDSQNLNSAESAFLTADGGYAVAGTLNDSMWIIKYAPEITASPLPTLKTTTPTPEPTSSSAPSSTNTEFPSPTSSPSPSEVPGQFSFSWVEVALAVAVLAIGGVAAYVLKRSQKREANGSSPESERT